MKTILIVDGYNAINAISETKELLGENLLSARSRIIMLTSEYVRSSGYINDFCVVFDGQDKYRHLEKLYLNAGTRQAFSRTGDGDEKIIETVRQYSSVAGVRVVVASNDNYVRNNSRGYGASLIKPEDIAGKKGAGKRGFAKSAPKDTDKRMSRAERDRINREYKKELGL
jgi:predicted RNA-binding protein with PIN domain